MQELRNEAHFSNVIFKVDQMIVAEYKNFLQCGWSVKLTKNL